MSTQLPKGFNTVEFPVSSGQKLACKTPEFVLRFLQNASSELLQRCINEPISEFAIQVLLKQEFAGKGPQDEVFYFQLNQNPDLQSIPINVIERMLNGAPLSLGSIVVNLQLKVMSTLGSEIDGQIILEAIRKFQKEVVKGDISELMGLEKYTLGLVLAKEEALQKTQAEQAVLDQWQGWESLEELETSLTPENGIAPLEILLCVYHHIPEDRRDHPINKDYLREILTQDRIIQSLQNPEIEGGLKKYIFDYFWAHLYQRQIDGVQLPAPATMNESTQEEKFRKDPICEPQLTEATDIDELKVRLNKLRSQVSPLSNADAPAEGGQTTESEGQSGEFQSVGVFPNDKAEVPTKNLSPQQINKIKNEIYNLETVIILWEMARNGGQRFGAEFGKQYTKIKTLLSNQDIKMLLQKACRTIGQEMGDFFAQNREAELLFSDEERINLYKDLAQTPGQNLGRYLACCPKSDEYIKKVAELLGRDNFFYVLRQLMVSPGQKAGVFFRDKMNFLIQYLTEQKVEFPDSQIFEWIEQASAVAGQNSAMILANHWERIATSEKRKFVGKNEPSKLFPGADEMINNTFATMGQNAGILLENRWKELRELDGNGINLRELVKTAAECQSQSIAKFLENPQGQQRIKALFPELKEITIEHIQKLKL